MEKAIAENYPRISWDQFDKDNAHFKYTVCFSNYSISERLAYYNGSFCYYKNIVYRWDFVWSQDQKNVKKLCSEQSLILHQPLFSSDTKPKKRYITIARVCSGYTLLSLRLSSGFEYFFYKKKRVVCNFWWSLDGMFLNQNNFSLQCWPTE